ncbi:XRE family transcriptional regulator [Allonocardiopsis opalescens]|uniref:XRE family transcriptional regulator n=1 Tax=Allonocardiopsis opalescens TaxID=1144618 RepID=UPI0011B2644B|nr:XRE family transcriptional regulator [Allonocardiopsis opalescens]
MVEQVRALFEVAGRARPKLGETQLSAYESGAKRPGAEYLHYLSLAYRADPDDLGYAGPCVCGQSHLDPRAAPFPGGDTPASDWTGEPPPDSISPPATPPDLRGVRCGEEDDNVLRQTMMRLLVGANVAMDGQLLAAIDGVRRQMDRTLVHATVSAGMLDAWEEATFGYGRQYMSTPPLRLLCDVLLDFSEVRRTSEQRQPVELQERLCRLAAQLAGIAGILLIDLGDQRMARAYFRTARTAADETGDRALRAWVVAREALVPFYYGDPREAMQLARRSRDLAGRAPCAATVLAPMIEARGLAMTAGLAADSHAVEQAKRLTAASRESFDSLAGGATSDTVFGYTERQLVFHHGGALAGLGVVADAERLLDDALSRYPVTELLDRTLIRFDQALLRLAEGEVEESLRMGRQAVTALPAEHRTDIVLSRARQLGATALAEHPDHPSVRAFTDAMMLPAR